jgi:hypothetical protein
MLARKRIVEIADKERFGSSRVPEVRAFLDAMDATIQASDLAGAQNG